jgi:hypothetical protein
MLDAEEAGRAALTGCYAALMEIFGFFVSIALITIPIVGFVLMLRSGNRALLGLAVLAVAASAGVAFSTVHGLCAHADVSPLDVRQHPTTAVLGG